MKCEYVKRASRDFIIMLLFFAPYKMNAWKTKQATQLKIIFGRNLRASATTHWESLKSFR